MEAKHEAVDLEENLIVHLSMKGSIHGLKKHEQVN